MTTCPICSSEIWTHVVGERHIPVWQCDCGVFPFDFNFERSLFRGQPIVNEISTRKHVILLTRDDTEFSVIWILADNACVASREFIDACIAKRVFNCISDAEYLQHFIEEGFTGFKVEVSSDYKTFDMPAIGSCFQSRFNGILSITDDTFDLMFTKFTESLYSDSFDIGAFDVESDDSTDEWHETSMPRCQA